MIYSLVGVVPKYLFMGKRFNLQVHLFANKDEPLLMRPVWKKQKMRQS